MSTATVESLRLGASNPEAEPTVAKAQAKRRLPFSPRTFIVVGIAILVAVAGAIYIALPKADVSTDAAYLEALLRFIVPLRAETQPRRTAAVAKKFLVDGRPPDGLY